MPTCNAATESGTHDPEPGRIVERRRRVTFDGVFAAMPEDALDGLVDAIVTARRIVVFGLGREG